MKWIREHISKMPSFNYLNAHLSTIENTIELQKHDRKSLQDNSY